MIALIGDPSLAFDAPSVLAPPQRPRAASGSHDTNLQIDHRKIRTAGGGAAGLAQPTPTWQAGLWHCKIRGDEGVGDLARGAAGGARAESDMVSGHGMTVRQPRARSAASDRVVGKAGRADAAGKIKGPRRNPRDAETPYVLPTLSRRRMPHPTQAPGPRL